MNDPSVQGRGQQPITIRVEPSRSWFGGRSQWKWGIYAGNGEPIDPRDTGANTGDIEDTMRTLVNSDVPVLLEIHYRSGQVVKTALRGGSARTASGPAELPNLLDATEQFMQLARQLDDVGFPDNFNAGLRQLRRRLLNEEGREYFDAEAANNLTEVVDGLLDLVVIAWGSLLAYVGPRKAKAAAAEVARSNLAKVFGPGLPQFRDDGKVIKPEGWQPPDIAGAIR